MFHSFPPPAYWQDFERLLKDLYPNMKSYGRQGQKQDGIDLYNPADQNQKIVIQAKQKDFDKYLSISQIESYAKKAKEYFNDFKFETLLIATTMRVDKNLQKQLLKLNISKKSDFEFNVNLIFWDELNEMINERNDVISKYYKEIYIASPKTNLYTYLSSTLYYEQFISGNQEQQNQLMLDVYKHLNYLAKSCNPEYGVSNFNDSHDIYRKFIYDFFDYFSKYKDGKRMKLDDCWFAGRNLKRNVFQFNSLKNQDKTNIDLLDESFKNLINVSLDIIDYIRDGASTDILNNNMLSFMQGRELEHLDRLLLTLSYLVSEFECLFDRAKQAVIKLSNLS